MREGKAAAAIEHGQKLLQTYPEHAEVLRHIGLGYLQQQHLGEAEHYLERALRREPASANVLNDLGIVFLKQQAPEAALGLFSRALELDAAHRDALGNIAVALTTLKQPDRAKTYLERLVRLSPFCAQARVKLARNSLALGQVEHALREARKAVRLGPEQPSARLALAEALETGGRFRQAQFQYLCVLSREPSQISALSGLLSLRRTRIDARHERQALQALDERKLAEPQQVQLSLALARYYDDRRQYEQAFAHLQAANDIKFRNHAFDGALYGRAFDGLISTCTAQLLRSLPSHEVHSARPIFIVGMPRSGTTLVEQILASHSQIAAGGELGTIANLAAQLGHAGALYPQAMSQLDGEDLSRMAQRYLARLDTISRTACHVTDKMPFNFMHLGLIVALFPDARIVHCRRAALDTCLSCYFTSFSEHLQFASDLETLGRYYLDYRRLMAHWRSVLPVPMLEVDYEQLVNHPEEQIRRLIAFCGVGWEAACLQFHRTERGVRTPSRWQVRQPLYRHSVGRWRPYERHLRPLLEILAPALQEDMGRASSGGAR